MKNLTHAWYSTCIINNKTFLPHDMLSLPIPSGNRARRQSGFPTFNYILPACREWAPKCTQLDSRCFGHSVAVRRQSALNVFSLVSLGQCLAVAFGGGVWRLSDAVPRPDKGSCEWAREHTTQHNTTQHTTRATPQVYLNKLRNVGADFVVVCCCRRDRGELVGDASIEPLNIEDRPL